jgi:hypothetical protein
VKRLSLYVAAPAFGVATLLAMYTGAAAQTAATPPPAPPSPNASAAPTLPPDLLATPKPKGTATPAPPKDVVPNRVGISGVWEIAIQESSGVVYTHFKLDQKGNVLTGQYLDESGKKYPLAGSVDGKTVRVVVSLPNGKALVFNGTQDAGADMVGTLEGLSDMVGFTAAYRPKYNWYDNLTPGAGGLGNGVP